MCKVDGCSNPARRAGWCWTHHARWRRHGDPGTVLKRGRKNHKGTDDIGYSAVHERLYRARGAANTHICECGQPAQQWAYDHSDPDPKFSWRRDLRYEVPYSLDLSRYVPMCIPCHGKADRARLAR